MKAIVFLLILGACASPDLVCADRTQRNLMQAIDELNTPQMDATLAAAQRGAPLK